MKKGEKEENRVKPKCPPGERKEEPERDKMDHSKSGGMAMPTYRLIQRKSSGCYPLFLLYRLKKILVF